MARSVAALVENASSGGGGSPAVLTCTPASSPKTTTTPNSATRTLSTQLSSALPTAQIGNIMHRIDAGLPTSTPAIAAPSAPGGGAGAGAGASTTSSGGAAGGDGAAAPAQFASSAANSYGSSYGNSALGLLDFNPAAQSSDTVSVLSDDAGARIASGTDVNHRNDFARFASLGNFSFGLGEGTPQSGSPEEQRIQSLAAKSPERLTVWGQGSVSALSNSAVGSEYSGQILSYTMGADYKPNSAFLVGSAFNYAFTDITTAYNNGQYREKSFTLLPYAAWRPDEVYSLQVVGGLARGLIGSNRYSSAFVTGDTTAFSWFMSGTGTARLNGGDTPWRVEGRLSALAGRRYVGSYTENDGTANQGSVSTTAQFRPGMEVGYKYALDIVTIEPFVRGEQIWDAGDAVNGSHTAWNAAGGLRALQGPVFGSVEYDQELGRDHYYSRTISGLFGYHFDLGDNQGSLSPQFQAGTDGGMQRMGLGLQYEPGKRIVFDLGLDRYSGTAVRANPLTDTAPSLFAAMTESTLYRLRMTAPF